jgi:hypothetical protein
MTGDPTIDSIILWLLLGAKMSSPYAVFALSAIVRCGIIPVIFWRGSRKNIVYTNVEIIAMIYVSSFVLVTIIGGSTNLPIVKELFITIQVAPLAIGIHQTQKIVTKAVQKG